MTWMAAVLLAGALVSSEPEMSCTLAMDIADAAEARAIYLIGEAEKTNSIIEHMTYGAEIDALNELRAKAVRWLRANCKL